MTRRLPLLLGAAFLAACASGDTDSADTAADTGTAPSAAAAGGDQDPDIAAGGGGGGIPAGYVGQVDPPRAGRAPADLNEASYTARDGRWEVRTGPAHIVYAAGDTARGPYTVSTTIEQLEAPTHAEAFGLIVGGTNLDQPSQRYTYFIVRHTGEYMVRVRDGEGTRDVIGWTATDAVPKSDANGRATYNLSVRVGADSAHFLVNERQVAAVPKANLPTDGVAGVRINHNLRLMVTPPTVRRGT